MGKYNINDAFIQALQEQELQEANELKNSDSKNIDEVYVPSYDEYKKMLSDNFLAIYRIGTNEDGMGDLDIFNEDGKMVGSIYNDYAGGDGGFEVHLDDKLDITNCKTAKEACDLLNKVVESKEDTIKLSGEMKDIDVSDGHITATPSLEREINKKDKKSLGQTQLTERKKYWDPVWREYDVDGRTFQFRCQYYEVSGSNQASLWGHEVTLKENYTELAFAKIPYYNRTWESFEFQSCMLSALRNHMKDLENSILNQVKQQNNVNRLNKDAKEQALTNDTDYQTLVKLKEMILNGDSGKKEESKVVEENATKKCDKSTIVEEIEAALNNALANVYDKCGVESGDISPDQALLWDDLVDQFAKLFETLCEQNSVEELDESKDIVTEAVNEKLTLAELDEKAHNGEWKNAVIVFKPESFEKEYSEESRSYSVSSDANYFQSGKISSSLFGYCLDGTDQGVRLDLYMKALPEDGLGKRWLVDYCYIIDEEKVEETININPTFADFYAKVNADDRFINEINDLYAKLLQNNNFSAEDIEREMDRDIEDKVAEILENGAYLTNEASLELAHELNKLLDESKEIKTEVSDYVSIYDEMEELLDVYGVGEENKMALYNEFNNTEMTEFDDDKYDEWLEDMQENHFDELMAYLKERAEETDNLIDELNEDVQEETETDNVEEDDEEDLTSTVSCLDIAISEIPTVGIEDWGKDNEINFVLDTKALLAGLKEFEVEIPKYLYDNASPDDWSNGIDEYLAEFVGISEDDGKQDNTYNWSACVTHDLEFTEYDTVGGYYIKASAHRDGDVRGNYTTEFLLKFDSKEDFFDAVYQTSIELEHIVELDDRQFIIRPNFFSQYIDIYESGTDNVWEDVYCESIEELQEIINTPLEESKNIRVAQNENRIKRESK